MRISEKSQQALAQALKVFPGGVNSPVRAFGGVGGTPPFIQRAEGAYLIDADGNRYIDYIGSWGPMILGHIHPEVLETIKEALGRGLSYGAPTEAETALALKLQSLYPSLEMMRLVSSGTEACMAALRVARGYTKREKILKFAGCYHGHADMLLVKAGSGALTFGLPDSPGVPQGATQGTLVASFNDIEGVKEIFHSHPGQIAAVILEPIVGNAGFIRPDPHFLKELRKITQEDGALLIFDEVMTGMRVALGGAQEVYGIRPDLTTLGKIAGGGMPLGVYGGRRDIMSLVAPQGPIYQAGTLSGNPIAVACGTKTLEILTRPGIFQKIKDKTTTLVKGIRAIGERKRTPITVDGEGGMFGFFFHPGPVRNLEDAKKSDIGHFKTFYQRMLDRGVYLAPSAFEACFMSLAHTDSDLENTLLAFEASL
jgi:glutamate-1-semialdehyde 2,1-aminomutase